MGAGGAAPVHRDVVAGDVPRLVAPEEQGQPHDVLGFADPGQQVLRRQSLGVLRVGRRVGQETGVPTIPGAI